MATWNLGACFVCLTCNARSVWKTCQRCRAETLDLREGFTALEAHWSAWPAFAQGRTIYSPRSIASFRILKWLAAIATLAAALAPVVGPFQKSGHFPAPLELAIALGTGLVLSPFVFLFFTVYFLFIANLLRGLSLFFSAAAAITPFIRRRFELIAMFSRFLSRPLIPQLEVVGPGELSEGRERGVLIESLSLDFVRDGWSLLERFDVTAVAPAKVKLDSGAETVVALEHGGIEFDQAMSKRTEAEAALPAWLQAPGRPGIRFRREFPAGARVVICRGRQANGDARVMLTLS